MTDYTPDGYRDDVYGDMKRIRDNRRDKRRLIYAGQIANGLATEVIAHSDEHRVIEVNGVRYDIWPSTLRWRKHGTNGCANSGGIRAIINSQRSQP